MSERVQLFAPSRSSWIETDYKIVSSFTEASFVNVNETSVLRWFFNHKPFDTALFWFGSIRHLPYLIFARLMRKRIVIIAGGYDVNNIPELRYGAFQEPASKRFLTRLVFTFADRILAVSEFTEKLAAANLSVPTARIHLAYLGIEASNAARKPWGERHNQVAFLISADRGRRLVKGIDLIPEICRRLPDVEFKLAGALDPQIRTELESENLPNLQLLGLLPFGSKDFGTLLDESKVICCPSRCESFGAAVLDGLMRGCRPVGFAVGALPEILDGLGVAVRPGDIAGMVSAIRRVLNEPKGVTDQEIQKAIEHFGTPKRRETLKRFLTFGKKPDGVLAKFLWKLRDVSLALPLVYPGVRFRFIHGLLWLLQVRDFHFEVEFFSLRYRGNIRNHIDFHVFFLGSYETGILNFMRSLVNRQSVFFDVGANMGHHSLFMAPHCRRVDAFEPYEPVRRVLIDRLERNAVGNVHVHAIGLGQQDTFAEFYEPPADNLGIGSFLKSHSELNRSSGLRLELRRGDSMANELKLDRLDLIKIDVEDAERNVLQGLSGVLEKFSPHVVVEVCRANVSDPEFIKLFPPGYDLFYIRNGFREHIKLEPFQSGATPAYVYARPPKSKRPIT